MGVAVPVTTKTVLDVRDLHVSYAGAVHALKGVSLAVAEGEVLAVLGANGAGKSTLLRALSGTLRAQRGTIDFAGVDLVGRDPAHIARAGLVQVPEGRRVFGELTVEENLRAGALAAKGQAGAAREWVDELFPILRQRRTQRAGLLSGGEQQMLAIGRALMASPKLLTLDEPSLGLAPRIVEQLREVIAEINARGVTVVLVEQNAAMALAVAHQAVVLEVGTVALAGTAAALADSEDIKARYLGRAPAQPPKRIETDGKRLEVENLSVRFGGISALSEVSFTVEPGSMHALIGPNGAGKSTCLNVLSGVYPATGGSVRYGDTELTARKPHRIAALGIARTFQNLALSPRESILDNLLVARHRLMKAGFLAGGLKLPSARRERTEHEQRVREIADLLGLDHLERPVGALSYGTRKRVELARALCTEPELLLLDEPVAGMVQHESELMAEAIVNARRQLAITVLLVEHDMAFVMGIADHITVLDFGRRIASGAPAEVQNDPEVLRAYLG